MKISAISLKIIKIPLRTPFKTALRTVEYVEDIVLSITAENGMTGLGEAPPTKAITGETLETIQAALTEHIIPAIKGKDIDNAEEILKAIQRSLPGNSSAKAAADMAVYDLKARLEGRALADLLAEKIADETKRPAVKKPFLLTDLTISVNDTEQMVKDAMTAVNRGFRNLKIKVGKEGKADLEKIREIRHAVGKEISIRVDANQGWTPDEAVDILKEAERLQLELEFVEQPVKAADTAGMAYVKARTDTCIVADESVFHPEDARMIFEQDAADMVNIKLMKAGGIQEACKIVRIAGEYGKHCMVGCMLESKIAVSAAAHLAAATDIVTAIDLDGPSLCATDPYQGGPVYDDPYIRINREPGLGITAIDSGFLTEIPIV